MAGSAISEASLDRGTRALRIPPHSIEAEQSVLGGLLIDNDAWERVADILIEQDFYRRDHRMVFAAIRALADQGKPFDTVTTADWLESQGALDESGGLAYLGELARDTPSAANIDAYAKIIRERSVLRGLSRVGTDIAESALQTEGRSALELLDLAERKVFELGERGTRGQRVFVPIRDVLANVMDRIDTLFSRDDPITGVATGFEELDAKTAGLQPSDLIIVAGRPAMERRRSPATWSKRRRSSRNCRSRCSAWRCRPSS